MDRMIGSGSFGKIYAAVDVQTGTDVACKFERANTKRQQMLEESKLLKQMTDEGMCVIEGWMSSFAWSRDPLGSLPRDIQMVNNQGEGICSFWNAEKKIRNEEKTFLEEETRNRELPQDWLEGEVVLPT